MMHYLFRSGNPELAPVLLLHSTGGNETELIQLADMIASEHPIIAIRGRVSEQGYNRYFERYAEGNFNLNSLEKESDWLVKEIKKLSNQFNLDIFKMIVIGYSNGANIALHISLAKNIKFAKIIALHAMHLTSVPVTSEKLKDTKIFVSYGENDPIVPKLSFDSLIENLKSAGANLEIHTQPGSHQLTRSEINAAQQWLK
ncbi:MAG TPA: alpha/beta hydrolase [Lactovum miscens]|uniref:alpha/beta hydrolase n=1 Tax=Lactovum miscens TaxID=190387 RepID=UPI002EDBACB0